MRNNNRLIAIIDDDDQVREAISRLMRSVGFAAETFSSAIEFLRSSRISCAACLIADINMPEMSGFDLFRLLLERGDTIPTILITAYPAEEDRSRALEFGVIRYMAKPFDDAELLDGVHIALARLPPNGGPQ